MYHFYEKLDLFELHNFILHPNSLHNHFLSHATADGDFRQCHYLVQIWCSSAGSSPTSMTPPWGKPYFAIFILFRNCILKILYRSVILACNNNGFRRLVVSPMGRRTWCQRHCENDGSGGTAGCSVRAVVKVTSEALRLLISARGSSDGSC